MPYPISQPFQRTKKPVKRGWKTWRTLLCTQLSISTAIHISRNKRCQKGQIWVITAYQVHVASRNNSKVSTKLLVSFSIGNFRTYAFGTFWKAGQYQACPDTHTISPGSSENHRQWANYALVMSVYIQNQWSYAGFSPRAASALFTVSTTHKAQLTSYWHRAEWEHAYHS